MFLLLSTTAVAADELAEGMAVAREVVAPGGYRFVFTVTPPPRRGVDRRIFDMFELEDQAEKSASSVSMLKKEQDPEPGDIEALDVSGYTVRIEQVGAVATGCSLKIPLVKFKKAKLRGGTAFFAQGPGASAVFVASYPVTGDVDAVVLRGDEKTGTLCSKSTKGPGQLDVAKCAEASCNTTGSLHTGGIVNFLSSDAEFVGAVMVSFTQ